MHGRGPNALGGNHIVDVRQLKADIPKKALREYEKAVREIKDHNTQRAIERLEKSIKLAPDFYMRIWVLRRNTERPIGWMPLHKNLLAHPN